MVFNIIAFTWKKSRSKNNSHGDTVLYYTVIPVSVFVFIVRSRENEYYNNYLSILVEFIVTFSFSSHPPLP